MSTGDFTCEHNLWLALCGRCNLTTEVKINYNNAACAPTLDCGAWIGESKTDIAELIKFPYYNPQVDCANPTFGNCGTFTLKSGESMLKKDKLGDNVEFDFNQTEIKNINRLIKLLKMRLSSSGKTKSKDQDDNIIYIDADIFGTDNLVGFLVLSLSDFNQIPSFTRFTFEDTKAIEFFTGILVSGATLHALASRALIERGREFQMTDNGVTFDPPNISELLETQYATLLEKHSEKVKTIKNYIIYWNLDE